MLDLIGGIEGDQALPYRVSEGLVEQPVEVPHRPGRQAALAVLAAGSEHLGVEAAEVERGQLLQPDVADLRLDVVPDVVPVSLKRLGRQRVSPTPSAIRPDADRASAYQDRRAALVDRAEQVAELALRIGFLATHRLVPDPAFPGDRVAADVVLCSGTGAAGANVTRAHWSSSSVKAGNRPTYEP